MNNGRGSEALQVALDQHIFVLQRHGGISRYFTRLAEHLPEFGVDARIISPIYFTELLKTLPGSKVLGRHFSWSPRKVWLGTTVGERLHAPLTRLIGAKIVHETYYHPSRLAPKGCKLVGTVHDMIAESNLHIPEAVVDMRAKQEMIKRVDLILCVSETTRQELIHYHPEVEGKTVVTPLGVDAHFSEVVLSPSPHPRPYILFVGVRRNYKKFDTLLEAFASSDILRKNLDVVCVSHHRFNETEVEMIRKMGLQDTVLHRHAEDEERLRTWYHHAAVLAQPSIHEGFGLPVLEAMASGCPVVCTNVSVMPEVCGGAAEYAEPADPESLLRALEAVVLSPERAESLRALGRERVKLFSWRECARLTSEAYHSLL